MNDTRVNYGSEILTKGLIEKYTNILAEENYKDNIANRCCNISLFG